MNRRPLARTYGVSLGEMFEMPGGDEPCVIIRSGEGRAVQGDGLSYLPLSNKTRFGNLQPIRLTVSADRRGDEMYQHEGEEWVYVLSGDLKAGGVRKVLRSGRWRLGIFDSRLPHRLTALGGRDAELILVACPVPESNGAMSSRPVRARRAIL